jgi:hypothetical protein
MTSVRVVLLLAVLSGCTVTSGTLGSSDAVVRADAGLRDAGSPAANTTCSAAWSQVTRLYSNATQLKACDGIAKAKPIVDSLMNLEGLTIDNNGQTMTPCLETRCDDTYVYVASNSLPRYDFVPTTPNPLTEVTSLYRVPMTAHPVVASAGATDAQGLYGCTTAYATYVSSPNSGTQSEPSGFCGANGSFYDALGDGSKAYYRKIPCGGTEGLTISGPPVFGPNEAATPDPWGNPGYNWPTAGAEIGPIQGATLDLCGGHTADVMHYHGLVEACFERDNDGKPKNSYVAAAEKWDFKAALDADCAQESGTLGWSVDGYPIQGPCVCLERNGDGSCKTVKRARSSWTYDGLSSWGAGTEAAFAKEGTTCSSTADCCTGPTCRYVCSWAVFPSDSAGGSVADKRCVLRDYAWCVNRFSDRSDQDVSAANFVYMDRCNGYEGPDGYAYHATASFPFLLGCYHGVPSDSSGGANLNHAGPPVGTDGGTTMPPPPDAGMMMGPPDGGLIPPCPIGQTSRCCGDGACEGPETHANCASDCH